MNNTLRNLFADAAMPVDMKSNGMVQCGNGMVARPVAAAGADHLACNRLCATS